MDEHFLSILKLEEHETALLANSNIPRRTKNALIRGKTMEILIQDAVNVFQENYEQIMFGTFQTSLTDSSTKQSFKVMNAAYDWVKKDVYPSKRKTILEVGAFSTLGNLLDTFAFAASQVCTSEKSRWSYKTRRIRDLLGTNLKGLAECDPNSMYYALMLVLDYITGMTDHYATEMNRKVLGLGL